MPLGNREGAALQYYCFIISRETCRKRNSAFGQEGKRRILHKSLRKFCPAVCRAFVLPNPSYKRRRNANKMKNKINRFCLCLISALLCLCLLGGCAGGFEEASRVSTTAPVSQDQDESALTEKEAKEKETVKAKEQSSTSKAQSTAEKSNEASVADKKATAKASTTSAKKKTATAKKASSQKEKATAPSSAKATTAASEEEYISCTVEIECKSILGNMDSLKKGHEAYVPSDGVIMSRVSVTVKNKSSAYDAVMLACEKQGVSVNSVNSAYGKYIAGFNNIDEKDCGAQSGWMYTVNGAYPSKSCDKYILKNHDSIAFTYTC